MKNFKYPLRIKGSFEELIEISKDLVELDYDKLYSEGDKDYQGNPFVYLVTNDTEYNGQLALYAEGKTDSDIVRTDVSARDKDLVLALAAMVDDDLIHVGEYVFRERAITGNVGDIHKVVRSNGYSFTTEGYKETNNKYQTSASFFRKATKEEIINHFMNKQQEGPVDWASIAVKYMNYRHSTMYNDISKASLNSTTSTTGTTENGSTINIINPTKSIEESVVKSRLETLLLDKPELQDALSELFPEVIEPMDRSVFVEKNVACDVKGERLLETRYCGDYTCKGFWLSDLFDWNIIKEPGMFPGEREVTVLVPTRKK